LTSSELSTPFPWKRAKDYLVYDQEDNAYIDMTSGIFVANAGHSNPKIVEALQKHLCKDLLFAYHYPTDEKQELEEKLLELAPGFDQVCLMSSGSEATDTAVQLMLKKGAKKDREYILSFHRSYHGRTLGSSLVSGSTERNATIDEWVRWLYFPCGEEELFNPLDTRVDPDEIAGVIIETYQGWCAGFYPETYLKDLCQWAQDHDIMICVDDIQAGFYRCGTLFGYQSYGDYLKPDLLCLGKGLTSSLPMSALLTKGNLDPIGSGGTHGGNTLCCAAALANIEFLTDPTFQKDYQKRAAYFEQAVRKLEKLENVRQVNARGMIAAVIFHDSDTADQVVKHCHENKVLPVHTGTTSIKLGPPLTIPKPAIDAALGTIRNGATLCLTT